MFLVIVHQILSVFSGIVSLFHNFKHLLSFMCSDLFTSTKFFVDVNLVITKLFSVYRYLGLHLVKKNCGLLMMEI